MKYLENLGPLEVERYKSLKAAMDRHEFTWTTDTTFIDGPVGCVYQRVDGGLTGLPGCVEVPLDIALLFAAAPDLLAACEAAIEEQSIGMYGTISNECIAALRAAITKAKGGTL